MSNIAMNNSVKILAVLILPMLAMGCAKKSTLGSAISAQGAEIASIGANWDEGDELLETGQEQIDEGNAMISKGRKLIKEGENNLLLGAKMKTDAETAYKARTGQELPVPE